MWRDPIQVLAGREGSGPREDLYGETAWNLSSPTSFLALPQQHDPEPVPLLVTMATGNPQLQLSSY